MPPTVRRRNVVLPGSPLSFGYNPKGENRLLLRLYRQPAAPTFVSEVDWYMNPLSIEISNPFMYPISIKIHKSSISQLSFYPLSSWKQYILSVTHWSERPSIIAERLLISRTLLLHSVVTGGKRVCYQFSLCPGRCPHDLVVVNRQASLRSRRHACAGRHL